MSGKRAKELRQAFIKAFGVAPRKTGWANRQRRSSERRSLRGKVIEKVTAWLQGEVVYKKEWRPWKKAHKAKVSARVLNPSHAWLKWRRGLRQKPAAAAASC